MAARLRAAFRPTIRPLTLTRSVLEGRSALVRRLKIFVVMSLVAPLVGSGVTWPLAVKVLAHGAHHVSLHSSAGQLAVVLEHEDETAHAHHHASAPTPMRHDPAATHAHRENRDHVVALSAPDPCCPGAARQLQTACGLAITHTPAIPSANPHAPSMPCVAYSRVGPPVPSRSSILRI
jgi:hypothetical protein